MRTSTYYERRQKRRVIDVERINQRTAVAEAFNESRGAAGSRTIVSMLRDRGMKVGRFKVSRLMAEAALVCKQPGPHNYKVATVERPDIPNMLGRQFNDTMPNQIWCGDITYIWAGSRWAYLAVVIDLYARRVVGWTLAEYPDASLVTRALEMAYECRGKPVSF